MQRSHRVIGSLRVLCPLLVMIVVGGGCLLALAFASSCSRHEEQASVGNVAVADTTDPLASLKQLVESNFQLYDRLLSMKGARPYPNDVFYIELSTYNQLENILETTIGEINRTAETQSFKQEEIAMYAMSTWGSRFAQFKRFHTSSMGGAYEPTGHNWEGIGRMAATYIPLLEQAFSLSYGTAMQIRGGSE